MYQTEEVKRVFKYGLNFTDQQDLELPLNAEVLTAQIQNGQLFIWALVKESNMGFPEKRTFRVAGTGHPIEGNVKYIATFQYGAGFVFHVFEVVQ